MLSINPASPPLSTLLLTCPWALCTEGKWEKGQWLEPYCRSISWSADGILDSLPGITQMQLHRQKLQRKVSLFAAVAQRKLYSQLLSAHETFVGVLLARGIPNRVILPRAGQSSTCFILGAILSAVVLQKDGSG